MLHLVARPTSAPRRSLPPPADAADRIVLATLACIEQDGIDGLTVRAIARQAGVNIAAINYYFGSKDHLVALVLERTLDEGVRDPLVDFDRLVAAGRDVRVALIAAVDELVGSAIRHPRTSFAHLHGPLVLQDYRRDVVLRTNALLERLHDRLRRRLVGRGDVAKRAALAQLWSTVLMTCLAPALLRPYSRVDLRDPKKRRAWVATLVGRCLVEPPKPRRVGGRARQRARRR
jgi:AcrR family transcriptional regulator